MKHQLNSEWPPKQSAFEDVKALTEWSSRSRPFVQVAAESVAHVGGVRFAARDGLETPDSDGEENAPRAPHLQSGRQVRGADGAQCSSPFAAGA